MTLDSTQHRAVGNLLGFSDFRAQSIKGGGNNRTYRVDTPDGPVLLKHYFRHPGDKRDRLGAEWGFSTFAWSKGLRALPRPMACDEAASIALYEFIEGQKIEPGQVTVAHVDQALAFYLDLNAHRESPEAAALPEASEACFTLAQHRERVAERVARLGSLEGEAGDFVTGPLAEAWQRTKATPIKDEAPITPCLSPSDFGFHNAILGDDGRLRFFDFEYAGWDDPAKLVCDFFCQVQTPVPEAFLDHFSKPIAPLARVHGLLPVYRIKWCCILLNALLPTEGVRRQFADKREHLQGQLELARGQLREGGFLK